MYKLFVSSALNLSVFLILFAIGLEAFSIGIFLYRWLCCDTIINAAWSGGASFIWSSTVLIAGFIIFTFANLANLSIYDLERPRHEL